MSIKFLSGVNVDSNTLVVDAANDRVGIGTASPNSILEISALTPVFRIQASDTANFHGIEFRQGAGFDAFIKQLPVSGEFRISNGRSVAWGGFMTFYTDTVERLRINSTGNVGIGTTSPNAPLDVTSATSNSSIIQQWSYNSAPSAYRLQLNTIVTSGLVKYSFDMLNNSTAYNNNLVLDRGNVGIGTTSPGELLEVVGNIRANVSNGGGFMLTGASASGLVRAGATGLALRTDTTDRLTIDNTGAATFSSSVAAASLSVSGVSTFGSTLVSNSIAALQLRNSNSVRWELDRDGTEIGSNSGSNFQLYRYDDSGNFLGTSLGITRSTGAVSVGGALTGTSATFSSSVEATSFIKTSGTAAQYLMADGSVSTLTNPVTGTGTTNYVPKFTSASAIGNSLIFDDGTNVGIGTASPAAKLEIYPGTITGASTQEVLRIDVPGDNIFSSATGYINFRGYDVSNAVQRDVAWIGTELVPNLSSSGWFGGNLIFRTTATGNAQTPQERVRITAAGNVGIGTTAPANTLQIGSVGTTGYAGNKLAVGDGTNVVVLHPGAVSYLTANGDIVVGAGGNTTNQLYVKSGGNVGIGTSSPASLLHIYGSNPRNFIQDSGTGYPYVQLNNSSGSFYLSIDSSSGSGFGSAYGRYLYSEGAYPIILVTNSAERLRITSAGNVGIGTTSPTKKLQIAISDAAHADEGILLQSPSGYGEGAIYHDYGQSTGLTAFKLLNTYAGAQIALSQDSYSSTGSPSSLRFYTAPQAGGNTPVERMRISSVGALKLNAYGSGSNTGTATQRLAVDASGNVIEIPIGSGPVDGNGTANYVTKWSDADTITNSIIYDNGTNVGIGTASPAYKLDVSGDIRSTTIDLAIQGVNVSSYGFLSQTLSGQMTFLGHNVRASNSVNNTALVVNGGWISSLIKQYYSEGITFHTSTTEYAAGATYPLADTERMRITSAGNVGIGTTGPATKLDVNGGINIANGNNLTWGGTYAAGIPTIVGYNAGTGGALYFYPNGSTSGEKMRLHASGNLSIGNTNDTYKLDVTGTGRFSDSLLVTTSAAGSLTAKIRNTVTAASGSTGYGLAIESEASAATSYALTVRNLAESTTYFHISTATGSVGNVGIGTPSPQRLLSVGGAYGGTSNTESVGLFQSTGNAYITVGTGASSQGGLLFADSGSNNAGAITYSHNTDSMEFGTAGAERMRITSAGNVGIGTTAPAYKLDVVGAINSSTATTSGTGTLNLGTTAQPTIAGQITGAQSPSYSSTGKLGFSVTTWGVGSDYGLTEVMAIDMRGADSKAPTIWMNPFGGNVGIGTTSPTNTLDVLGSTTIRSSGGGGALNIGTNSGRTEYQYITLGGGTGGTDYGWQVGRSPQTGGVINDGFYIYDIKTNNAPFTIALGGNVGIGTTGPSEKLHVDGSALITYNNSFQSTNSVGNKAILARVSPTSGIINYAEYATATNLNGFVIGSDDARVKGNITGDSLEFITNTSTRMTVLSSGNVGINTTTPGSTLHVVGDVLIQTGALGVGVNPSATDGRIDAGNDIVAFSTSDKRLKENITPIANALEKVRSLTGVEFDWKEETKSVHGYEGHDVGVIAQDVQAVLPEAVRTNETGYLSVRYEKMIALLIEANKELANRVEQLEKLIK